MVRLVITDFPSKDDNVDYYIDDEYAGIQKLFTYFKFKKYSLYLSKYDTKDDIYSLNVISKKMLPKNKFLVYMADEEFIILFNHKTVYSAKINQNFITDDIVKSILITKHLTMLSSSGQIKHIYYIANSKYNSAVENILKQNTKNEDEQIVAQSLGEIKDIVEPLNKLDSSTSYFSKIVYLLLFAVSIWWIAVFGLKMFSDRYLGSESLDKLKREINLESRLLKRQEIILNRAKKDYEKLISCMRVKPKEKKER